MKKYRFYKDQFGWFIDLKWFPFNRAYLAMVQGADDLLDIISDNRGEVTLRISTSPILFYDGMLERKARLGTFLGAFYKPIAGKRKHVEKVELVWLCPVTLWVFLRYPKQIYFKIT